MLPSSALLPAAFNPKPLPDQHPLALLSFSLGFHPQPGALTLASPVGKPSFMLRQKQFYPCDRSQGLEILLLKIEKVLLWVFTFLWHLYPRL